MSTVRNYLSDAQYQAITGNDTLGDDADRIIGAAESVIDGFLGAWPSFYQQLQGVAADASADSLQLQPQHAQLSGIDYLQGLVIEFQNGQAVGEFRTIAHSTRTGLLTFDKAFTKAPQAGDVYHIYQIAKIPRAGQGDVTSFSRPDGVTQYYRQVPIALREAVAWQIAYIKEMGEDYFNGNAMNLDSESFGSYSYTKSAGAKNGGAMVSPKAKAALRGSGLINRTGQITDY